MQTDTHTFLDEKRQIKPPSPQAATGSGAAESGCGRGKRQALALFIIPPCGFPASALPLCPLDLFVFSPFFSAPWPLFAEKHPPNRCSHKPGHGCQTHSGFFLFVRLCRKVVPLPRPDRQNFLRLFRQLQRAWKRPALFAPFRHLTGTPAKPCYSGKEGKPGRPRFSLPGRRINIPPVRENSRLENTAGPALSGSLARFRRPGRQSAGPLIVPSGKWRGGAGLMPRRQFGASPGHCLARGNFRRRRPRQTMRPGFFRQTDKTLFSCRKRSGKTGLLRERPPFASLLACGNGKALPHGRLSGRHGKTAFASRTRNGHTAGLV